MKKEYKITVNDLDVVALYEEETVEKIFKPLLKKWTELQKKLDRRIIVMLAAPPGTGKTTLALFLESLSKEDDSLTDIQTIGMDGFHFHEDYLRSHYIEGTDKTLKTIKGAYQTFDVERFKEKIIEAKTSDNMWPVYSRVLHDVEEDKIKATGKIILIEGNYLFLNIRPWDSIKELADDTVFVGTNPDYLEERLVNRKMMGGSDKKTALDHFNNVDKKNAIIVMEHSTEANTMLEMDENENIKVK